MKKWGWNGIPTVSTSPILMGETHHEFSAFIRWMLSPISSSAAIRRRSCRSIPGCLTGSLQDLAAENNLAETAFFVPEGQEGYRLRWFTPTTEVDLCGHATLASGFVIMTILRPGTERVEFATQVAGTLAVTGQAICLHWTFPPVRLSRRRMISIR